MSASASMPWAASSTKACVNLGGCFDVRWVEALVNVSGKKTLI